MALIVEDGSIVADAESYVSVTDADTIISNRGGNSNWDGLTVTDKEIQLRIATEYIDSKYNFLGEEVSSDQELSFPRAYLPKDGADEIPKRIQRATAVLAAESITIELYSNVAANRGAIKRTTDKLDVLETTVEYFSGGSGNDQPVFGEVRSILKPLICSSIGRS